HAGNELKLDKNWGQRHSQCGDMKGLMMLKCSASAAATRRSISACDSFYEPFDLGIWRTPF
ncbi:hypothetical protein, partial [Mesorhizobium sp. M7A.F.Ca.US.001.02.1.1]|uniref:hypothetical protein n=1 Tax=Mesorhizobium sp. M7A.F.Ca.US.001.02.1.1 TaxID=2496703 RepID=UPI0019D44073